MGKLNTRVLWFFMKGRRIVAVHGIRNSVVYFINTGTFVAPNLARGEHSADPSTSTPAPLPPNRQRYFAP